MQHRIGDRGDTFGADLAGGWAKEHQQFGGAPALVLVRLAGGMAFRLPRGSWLRDGLIRTRFIFVQLHDAGGFRLLVRLLDQSFFSGVSTS